MRDVRRRERPGYFLPMVMLFAVVSAIIMTAILSVAFNNFSIVKRQSRFASALNVAEAGVNYYLWHLSHNFQDYCDGNACSGSGPFGPYVHQYKDPSGNEVGQFSLTITPPTNGSNRVRVRSEGTTTSGEKRTVVSEIGLPSFAQYAFITNSQAWFKSGSQTSGLVHSNLGIKYDATANAVISAAAGTYTPNTCFGGDDSTEQNGVWGSGGPTNLWQFPVPQVDFNSITAELGTLQDAAIDDGLYLPTLVNNRNRRTYSGYALQLQADGKVRIGRVTAQRDDGGSTNACALHGGFDSIMQTVSWDPTPVNLPTNGVIFVADHVWISGVVTSRLTIASGRLPDVTSTNTNVFLQDDITYSANDGTVALGVVSQSDIVINPNSEDDLVLNGYFLSQKGKVFRPYYPGNLKTKLTINGGIGSNSWSTWNWTAANGTISSGYQTVIQSYDNYLTLTPPPLFPKTGSYAILSWKEEPIL